jgi:nucleoside-diphosphate-sugar epimerase
MNSAKARSSWLSYSTATLSRGSRSSGHGRTIRKVVGYPGRIEFDTRRPEGTFRKLMDVSRIRGLGWQAETSLEVGLRLAIDEWKSRKTTQ